MEYTRLFDVLYYQQEHYPTDRALCEKINNQWQYYSTAACLEKINEVSRALHASGLRKGDKVAIISGSRPAWNFVDMGAAQLGIITVPVYPNISQEEYKFIFNDAGICLAFTGDKAIHQKVAAIKDEVESLKDIYCLHKIEGIPFWEDLLATGTGVDMSEIEAIKSGINELELATIIYTSGTTGTPKGVMLSHYNMISNAKDSGKVIPLEPGQRTVSMLPICHIFERTVTNLCMYRGASIHYIERLETIGENLKEIKPHFFSTVPRILEKIYEKIVMKGASLTGFKKTIFDWAHKLAENYEFNNGPLYKLQLAIADRLVFTKWREATGGELFGIVSGAAALQPRLARIFTAAGIPVKEGYGQTECSPVAAVNRFTPGGTRFGKVGLPIPNVQMKIAADGEICIKGANVMMGYYKRPDLTAETIDSEGWLHTGDVGEVDKDGFFKLTDRKKELFKTSGGKYVAPQVIENKFKESFFVEHIMVVGENKKTISAIIVPAHAVLQDWAAKNNIPSSNREDLVRHPEVIKYFARMRDEFNKGFGEVEKVKKIVLLSHEWTVHTGELTPTLKLKRKVIMQKYAEIIGDLYGED